MSEFVNSVADPDFSVAPRTTISHSLVWLTFGLTTVKVSSLSRREAEPFSPQKEACLPSRSYSIAGEEKMVRSAWPPWCEAYIANKCPTGVTTNLSSRARYKLFKQLINWAQFAMAIFSG